MRVAIHVSGAVGNDKLAIDATRHRNGPNCSINARTMMGCDQVIHLSRLRMHEVSVVRISGEQYGTAGRKCDESRQTGVIEIAYRALAFYN
jgi:hypothetical protein